MWPYWLLVALLALLAGCLCVVACQRDKATAERDTYRAALWRADPVEARALSTALRWKTR